MEKIDNKKYTRKTFLLDKGVVEKLQKLATKENRSLNWVVKTALLEYSKKI
jgi:predicted transcriptional regulator